MWPGSSLVCAQHPATDKPSYEIREHHAIAALITGLIAAYYWHRSTTVTPNPGGSVHSGEAEIQDAAWTTAILEANSAAGQFNKIAALWTALTVVLGAASSIFGAFAC